MKKKFICPVCGYDQMDEPPADHNICSCCGTHFGYHDVGHSWSELRKAWLRKGAPWFSQAVSPPPGWSAIEQLRKLQPMVEVRGDADGTETKLRPPVSA